MKLVRYIPFINIPIVAMILVVFGFSNPITSSVIVLLAITSVVATIYRARVLEPQKEKNMKFLYISILSVVVVYIVMNLVY